MQARIEGEHSGSLRLLKAETYTSTLRLLRPVPSPRNECVSHDSDLGHRR